MKTKLDGGEIAVMLTYLLVRAALVGALGYLLWDVVGSFAGELEKGNEANPATTGFLGLAIGALASGFTLLVGSLSVDVLGYLKDRLGTRGKAED